MLIRKNIPRISFGHFDIALLRRPFARGARERLLAHSCAAGELRGAA